MIDDSAITAELSQQEDNEEFRSRPLDETQADLGSRECLHSEKNLAYYPAETDVSIRPGWFYHQEKDGYDRVFRNEDRNRELLIRLQWNEEKFPLSEFIKTVEYCSRTPLRMGIRGLQKRKEPYERLHKMVG